MGRRSVVVGILCACVLAAAMVLGGATAFAADYPKPRFPSYLKPPRSVEDLMPAARTAVRQTGGMSPLGLAKPGQKVLILVPSNQEPMVVEAIIRAFKERGVDATVKYVYDLRGMTREQAIREVSYTGADGWLEIVVFNKDMVNYLPEQDQRELRPRVERGLSSGQERQFLKRYLDANPHYDAIFAGGGGLTFWKRDLGPHGPKVIGVWIYKNAFVLNSRIPYYPADVWRSTEEKIIEPLAWVEEVRVTDPEGTDFRWKMTEPQAKIWANSAYSQNHLFLYPLQGTGRFPYSMKDFPAYQKDWLLPLVPDGAEGVIGGTSNHLGYFPHMLVHVKDGIIQRVEGGGRFGELIGKLLQNPKVRNTRYPYMPRPGYFYMMETALGTNPKYFRPVSELQGDMWLANSSERQASGVFHWGLGIEFGAPDPDNKYFPFVRANKVPGSHSFHIHNLFATYEVKIRGAGQWLKLVDRGRVVTLDSFEARALASRYGNPDEILKDDWRADIPGINVPGDYKRDFAQDPWKYVNAQIQSIMSGRYAHFAP